LIDQEIIHNLCLSEDPEERIKALEQLKENFSLLPNKQQAWDDLHRLTNDKDSSVRSSVVATIGSALPHISSKREAWNDIHILSFDEDSDVRYRIAEFLGSSFSQVLDKQQAWSDIHRLSSDEDSDVRYRMAGFLGSLFFQSLNKQQVWNDLIRLAIDEDCDIRYRVTNILGSVFSQVPDKQQAWNDLIKLTLDKDSDVRYIVGDILGSVLSQAPDKQKAWNDLLRLINDEDISVRFRAAEALVSSFSHVPDKQQAWNDLLRLINDEDIDMTYIAAEALVSSFSHVPDKQQAWNDLLRLINDKDSGMMYIAAEALVSSFSHVPDKQQAWNDLIRLANGKSSFVRYRTVEALGSAFSQVPDKEQAWNDLLRLTNDQDSFVRTYANYSLGKVSIFKASQAITEENYRKELENAIEFFEKASQESKESKWFNPSQFCLPFYRLFYTIIFKRQEAREELSKYLKEAKDAVRGSKNKEMLFEAVENLADALKEVQNLEYVDLELKKSELDFYRKYYEHAEELLEKTEETSPYATETLRKGFPFLDNKLKIIIEEIKEKAKTACQVSQGTPTQEISCIVNREVQKWEIGNQKEMSWYVPKIVLLLKSKIPHTLENEEILGMIESMKYEKDLTKQYITLSSVIGLIPTVNVVPIEPVIEKIESSQREILEEIRNISNKLDNVVVYVKPGLREELILHIGAISSVGGGVEYTLTVPLQGLSYPEIMEDLITISGKRISQLSMLPKKIAKIVKEYLIENQMEDLLNKLC
jgi:HEAT repeat protein